MCLKTTILTFSLLIATISFSQQTAVLALKDQKHFSEETRLHFDTSLVLVQETCHDKPNVIDEEYCLVLKMSFPDTLKARRQQSFDITKDTSLIRCSFELDSFSNWEPENTVVTGRVKIKSWTIKTIEIDFDLTIHDLKRKWTYLYKGSRIFTPKVNLQF